MTDEFLPIEIRTETKSWAPNDVMFFPTVYSIRNRDPGARTTGWPEPGHCKGRTLHGFRLTEEEDWMTCKFFRECDEALSSE